VVNVKPLLLDLFCGAGGAAMGYHEAGFDILGVDSRPQKNYPFAFIQGDALKWLKHARISGHFHAIHASPPCQDHSPLRAVAGTHGTGWLLDATLELLRQQPTPWVVENVMGASMGADVVLCGGMFGLRTYRHRKFSIDPRLPILLSEPYHPPHVIKTSTKKRRKDFNAGMHISITGDVGSWLGPACMGIDWMTGNELSQAIPPAYTKFIGEQLIQALERAA
jgi:DNA (cytosine-5)-methyltransferase 1